MKLKNAAKFFDRDTVTDGYTGDFLFKGQWGSFEASKPDGSFERRRTVSVAPEVQPAPRRVVTIGDEMWLMGEFISDSFFDAPIRKTCSAKLVTHNFDLLTPGQAALGNAPGTSMYGHTMYLKDTVNTNTNSEYTPFYNVNLASTEWPVDGQFLRSHELFLHIRSTYREVEGFWTVASDEISPESASGPATNCEVTAVFEGAVNPVTEVTAASQVIPGILMEMYMLYAYQTQADPRNLQGDKTLIVAKTSITPAAGQRVVINSEPWRVERITSYQDAWNVHLRRA